MCALAWLPAQRRFGWHLSDLAPDVLMRYTDLLKGLSRAKLVAVTDLSLGWRRQRKLFRGLQAGQKLLQHPQTRLLCAAGCHFQGTAQPWLATLAGCLCQCGRQEIELAPEQYRWCARELVETSACLMA